VRGLGYHCGIVRLVQQYADADQPSDEDGGVTPPQRPPRRAILPKLQGASREALVLNLRGASLNVVPLGQAGRRPSFPNPPGRLALEA